MSASDGTPLRLDGLGDSEESMSIRFVFDGFSPDRPPILLIPHEGLLGLGVGPNVSAQTVVIHKADAGLCPALAQTE